jgi:nucleoside-diphosphate-sugar epimerase
MPEIHTPAVALEPFPRRIGSEQALDDVLTQPTPALIREIKSIQSPLILLGAGGKMGPSLAVLARRAADISGHPLKVIAVSRFSNPDARRWLEARGIETLSADLLDASEVARLPDSNNLIYLVGLKFGTAENPSLTWAMNTLVPHHVSQRYANSSIVAVSTGNVYPMSPVAQGGSLESDPLTPVGEYPNAAVARERIFEFQSRRLGTPVALLRLFYAVELRYGVVSDIARIIHRGDELPLANGFFNCIWQRDANEQVLRSFPLCQSPPSVWNLCQPRVFSVRETAVRLGELLGRAPRFSHAEADTALLGNAQRLCQRLGTPLVSMDSILECTADWVMHQRTLWNKPTHFEVRDGRY